MDQKKGDHFSGPRRNITRTVHYENVGQTVHEEVLGQTVQLYFGNATL